MQQVRVAIVARRALVVIVILIVLNALSVGVHSQQRSEDPRRRTWRLSWHVVDRGFVSWGVEAEFHAGTDCFSARDKAVQRTLEAMRLRGNEISVNDATIIETHREARMVLTVARFACVVDREWTLMVAHQSRTGAVSMDRISSFKTEENCIEALELEVDFKTKAIQKLGNYVSVVQSTPTDWILSTTEALGAEAGQLKTTTAYTCVIR